MVARGVQSFCILEGATDLLIEQWLKFLCQFTPDIWWTNTKNFKSISWVVSDLWSFNWKMLATAQLLLYKLASLSNPWKEFLICWKKWLFEIFWTSAPSVTKVVYYWNHCQNVTIVWDPIVTETQFSLENVKGIGT